MNSRQKIKQQRFPFSDADLQRFRLILDRRAGTVPPGERLMRKRGQSLEFREYEYYVPGDDARLVDWRLSLSRGAPWEFWKRTFDAEEALRIVITVDQSPTMDGPEGAGKRLVAAWLAESLSRIALLGKDRAVLHRMESAQCADVDSANCWSGSLMEISSQQAAGSIRGLLQDQLQYALNGDGVRLVEPFLKPGTVWLIVSDFFCPQCCSEILAASVVMAIRRKCTVAVVELDSWPWERARITDRACQIEGPGLDPERHHLRFDVDSALLKRVEQRIAASRDVFFQRAPLVAMRSRWSWPPSPQLDLCAHFREWFSADAVIADLLTAGGAP